MITVVSVTFSVTVVALTVSSQHFGPRLLRSFMDDQPAQFVLGIFTGTFAYCLMVLRTVQGDGGDRFSRFVPHAAVAGAIVLTLVAVGMLIYYVHHIAVSLQVAEITRRIAHELEAAIDRLYPDPLGEGADPPTRTPPPVPPDAEAVASDRSGYIQEVDSDTLIAFAEREQITIWLTTRPGDFVIAGEPLIAIHPPPASGSRSAGELARAYVIGSERTSYQDAGFAVQQLVEIALRALSPGMNEPFTAMTVIDRLGQALRTLTKRRIPSAVRTDGAGHTRVITTPSTFEELANDAFEPIVRHAARDPAVLSRLLATLERVARGARRSEDCQALARLGNMVRRRPARRVEGEHLRQTSR
jgi:uncharacterized membrane protein